MKNLSDARQNLYALENEKLSLRSNVFAAVESGDIKEITRLKGRELSLPSEIKAAVVLVEQAEFETLEAEQVQNYQNLEQFKFDWQQYQDLTLPECDAHLEEYNRLRKEAFSVSGRVSMCEAAIQTKNRQIADKRRRLEELVDSL